MPGRIARVLDQWALRRAQTRWAGAAATAGQMDAFALRSLRGEARAMRREIDRVIHATEHRLAVAGGSVVFPRLPLGTDWSWRADAWSGPLPQPGAVTTAERLAISEDLALYLDCPLREVIVRQMTDGGHGDGAPFGLAIEVLGFRGSFLSLSLRLPEAAVAGLKARHLIRVDSIVDADRTLRGFARLNIKHGPNVTQLVSDLPRDGRQRMVEFDLAYAKLDETRIDRAWLDVIFNDVAGTGMVLRDMVVSRRPRAEL